jgi:hypothetical protein
MNKNPQDGNFLFALVTVVFLNFWMYFYLACLFSLSLQIAVKKFKRDFIKALRACQSSHVAALYNTPAARRYRPSRDCSTT